MKGWEKVSNDGALRVILSNQMPWNGRRARMRLLLPLRGEKVNVGTDWRQWGLRHSQSCERDMRFMFLFELEGERIWPLLRHNGEWWEGGPVTDNGPTVTCPGCGEETLLVKNS